MLVIDLINEIKRGVDCTYYPNSFPATAGADCATVQLTGGAGPGRNLARPSFQVLVRSANPANAEVKAWEIYDYLNQKRYFNVGATHVIFCNAQQSTPLYIGTDDNGRFLYSLNFQTITD